VPAAPTIQTFECDLMYSQVPRRSMVILSKFLSGRYSNSSRLATVFCNFALFKRRSARDPLRFVSSICVASSKISIREMFCLEGEEKASMSAKEILSAPSCSKFKANCFSDCLIVIPS
jgi:hypothetical protein